MMYTLYIHIYICEEKWWNWCKLYRYQISSGPYLTIIDEILNNFKINYIKWVELGCSMLTKFFGELNSKTWLTDLKRQIQIIETGIYM